jgi:hypothetical protein
MELTKKISFFSLLFLINAISLMAVDFQTVRNEKNVVIKFAEELAIKTLILPTNNDQLWGESVSCRAVTLNIANQNFIGSAGADENTITFRLNGLIDKQLLLTPVFIEQLDMETKEVEVIAKLAETKRIENEIFELSRQVYEFQQKNRCFSCHTIFPLAIALNEADREGYKVSQLQIEKLGESIASMQRADGSFFFADQPEYGTISPTLCAGAATALLARFDRRNLLVIDRIADLFPGWLDEENDMKSDFFFRPMFLGKPTSVLFESMIIASEYYFRPSITGEPHEEQLRERLIRLNNRFETASDTARLQNLIILTGLPYIGQFNDQQKETLLNDLRNAQTNDPMLSRPDCAALSALFFRRMNDEKGLQQLKLLQTSGKTLSERIWLCLIKILQNQPGRL